MTRLVVTLLILCGVALAFIALAVAVDEHNQAVTAEDGGTP